MVKSSDTGGVLPMQIAGRMVRERERCIGMTDEERSWRAQWLKDQELTAREPVYVQEYHDALLNPIRRFYRAPLDKVWRALTPVLGKENAYITRHLIGKGFIGVAAIYSIYYYFKYNQNDWTKKSGWRVLESRKRCVPGDPDYPRLSDRTKHSDYAARGFKESAI